MNQAVEATGGSTIPLSGKQTMWADTTQLYSSAYTWEWTITYDLVAAMAVAQQGTTAHGLFGLAMSSVADKHQDFMELADRLLSAGMDNAAEMGKAIRLAADDFVRTDDGAASDADRVRRAVEQP
ncbi:hypothetical protein [Nocardioides rubriscoriae]|uniref:hypothetical protein n=1 Tax=Nocardioides rubriscoriae TaxID=642762 RepID=UPI0011DF7C68|nr:hypothetical protein [Nocardioides rubriscoriae]